MWIRSFSKTYQNVSKENIWRAWSDINNWHKWDREIEFAKLEGPFLENSHFLLKPKGGPTVKIQLFEIKPLISWTDCTKFPGAKMYGKHEMAETSEGLILKTTMTVKGLLSFLWVQLVAKGIHKTLEEQTDALVNFSKIS